MYSLHGPPSLIVQLVPSPPQPLVDKTDLILEGVDTRHLKNLIVTKIYTYIAGIQCLLWSPYTLTNAEK